MVRKLIDCHYGLGKLTINIFTILVSFFSAIVFDMFFNCSLRVVLYGYTVRKIWSNQVKATSFGHFVTWPECLEVADFAFFLPHT